MEPKLRDYVENLFAHAPRTKQAYELKEEIIRNTIDRYHDLVAEGKSEGEAYNLAIAGIGDINELLEALGAEPLSEKQYSDEQLDAIKNRSTIFRVIAVALYILCVTPVIFLSEIDFGNLNLENFGVILMFFMISTATGLLIYGSMTKFVPTMDEVTAKKLKNKATLRAVAVGLYISCPTPCIILDNSPLVNISPVFMFLIVAAATVMIILSKTDKSYRKADDTMVESFKEFNGRKKKTSALYKILVAILWVTTSLIYIWLTIATGLITVSVTWILFLVAVAVQNLMKAIFDYVEASK